MKSVKNIAILGGGEKELNILSEFHRNPVYHIIGIYDRDPRAVGLEIAEIIGIPVFTDSSFVDSFRKADYIIVTDERRRYEEEVILLKKENLRIINPSEAVNHLVADTPKIDKQPPPWPAHLEMALKYIERITDRERLLRWLLEISVRAVQASSGSIMLSSEETAELYIGYATGLSAEVVSNTRQKIGEGIAGKVAEEKSIRLITNIVDNQLYAHGRERKDIQSAISAPLVFEDKLIGVLNISTDRNERILTNVDIETITLLAEKISPILDQHLRIDTTGIREKEFEIRNFLESLFKSEAGFHHKFSGLCRKLCETLNADTVTIYTATDEGDWLILGGSDQYEQFAETAPRIHCLKGSLARAYLTGKEILMTEATHDPNLQIKESGDSITSIYLPLVHNAPLGVLVMEFSALESLEQFLKLKDTLRFQVGFFAYAQLRELKQQRKMKRYEELSALTPFLMGMENAGARLKHIPGIVASVINASMGSFYFKSDSGEELSYFGFPENKQDRETEVRFDNELRERAIKELKPECTSFLTGDVGTFDKMPTYTSVISYPFSITGDFTAVFNGYSKTPETPLDSTVFGKQELGLLEKVCDILTPILKKKKTLSGKDEPSSFNELLKSNQKIFLERIREEIERAERYHHGFTVTLFKVVGLNEYYRVSSHHALDLINTLSKSVRSSARKTDYFSWIETDIFGIISLESFQRIGDLEKRILGLISGILEEKGLFERERFNPISAFSLYPGNSETASDLISTAMASLKGD
ncbi:MAG: GAF domain-containing protein [Candidatus Krumholzibacteria bacterium]|nr:GAF domain-containing protein [Candidatus Krumholzibacteria bacterium]